MIKMGAHVYLREYEVEHVSSHHSIANSANLKEAKITFSVSAVGDKDEVADFIHFIQRKMITILQSHYMDWHVKEDNERIEFLLDIMGRIMNLQSQGRINEADAMLKLVDIIMPDFQNEEQYQTAEDLRNTIFDNMMEEKHGKP